MKSVSVLEIGCGTGFYTEYCLRNQVGAYVGVDITEVSVRNLQERYPSFSFIHADVSSEEFLEKIKQQKFDVVLAADVLFHIVDDIAFSKAVRNLCSSLQKDGLLIISDVFPVSTTQVAPHVRLRSLETYRFILSENFVSILRIEPIFALLHPSSFSSYTSWFWKGYALLWKIGQPIARWQIVDQWLPRILAFLYRRLILTEIGDQAPSNKWLLAFKQG